MTVFDIISNIINPCYSYTNVSVILYYGTNDASITLSGKRFETNDEGHDEVKNFSKFVMTTKDVIGDITSKNVIDFIKEKQNEC